MTWTKQIPSSGSWNNEDPTSASWSGKEPLVFSRLLHEDGSFLLQEDLFFILLNNYDWSSLNQNTSDFVKVDPTVATWTESIPN